MECWGCDRLFKSKHNYDNHFFCRLEKFDDSRILASYYGIDFHTPIRVMLYMLQLIDRKKEKPLDLFLDSCSSLSVKEKCIIFASAKNWIADVRKSIVIKKLVDHDWDIGYSLMAG
jgi:hypothetical protein